MEKKTYRFDPSRYLRYFERPYLSAPARRFLFDERRLDPRVISWCRITSWQDRDVHHWLQTPYYDMDGQLIGIQSGLCLIRHSLPTGCKDYSEYYLLTVNA